MVHEPNAGAGLSYNPRHKSWNTCVRFPIPNTDLGITAVSVLQNTRFLNIEEGEGTLQWEQKCEE